MNNPAYILVDEFRTVVQNVWSDLSAELSPLGIRTINYDFGYIENLNARLNELSANPSTNDLKFPLVWVRQPFDIVKDYKGWYGETRNLDVFIIAGSVVNYTEQERMDKVFKPIINKIYMALLKRIQTSPAFEAVELTHTETDFYYWGEEVRSSTKTKSVLNDIIDTKRISDLVIKVNNNKNCLLPGIN